jgi:hypothetical protein
MTLWFNRVDTDHRCLLCNCRPARPTARIPSAKRRTRVKVLASVCFLTLPPDPQAPASQASTPPTSHFPCVAAITLI